jgi:hypothetical protein
LLAVAFALIAGIGVIWFAVHKERTLALTHIPTQMPTSTPTSSTEAGVLAKGVVTIHENQWCDLERGSALPNEQDEKEDLTWRRGSLDAPVLTPYSGTGIIYLKQEIREEYFEEITKRDISGQHFINGKIVVAGSPNDTVYLQSKEIYFYFIRGRYYGKFRVESKTPDLVISFVTFK